jgi:hypothetical protein
MGWIYATSRPSGRLNRIDAADDENPINGFVCHAELRAFAIRCPSCGAEFDIRMRDTRSHVFDRRKQRFRCSACRFAAGVRVAVDIGFAPDEQSPVTAAQ